MRGVSHGAVIRKIRISARHALAVWDPDATFSSGSMKLGARVFSNVVGPDARKGQAMGVFDMGNAEHSSVTESLAANAHEILKFPVGDALRELSGEWGMAWADVAVMVGASVPALRKWRAAEGASGENYRKVAELLAFIRALHEVGVNEPAVWILMPLVDGYTVTPRHLYGSMSVPTLVDVASSSGIPEAALDELSPGWRQSYATDFELTTAADRQPAIVNRRQSDG